MRLRRRSTAPPPCGEDRGCASPAGWRRPPPAAKSAFQTGLDQLDASSKIRARLLTGLATVHVRQGEIEQACRTTGEALRIATRTRTGPEPYHRTTVYLTDEQRQWLRRAAAKAQLEGLTVSASDLIRLALSRLQDQVSEKQLHKELAAHVLAEAEPYPGRAKRGLPPR